MHEICRIINQANHLVSIDDIDVKLDRYGSYAEVPSHVAHSSTDLAKLKKWLSIQYVKKSNPMPFWPLIFNNRSIGPKKSEEPHIPESISEETNKVENIEKDISEIKTVLNDISNHLKNLPSSNNIDVNTLLNQLVTRGSERINIPEFAEVRPDESKPIFVPSNLVPKNAEVRIKKKEETVEKEDMQEGLAALRRLKKNR